MPFKLTQGGLKELNKFKFPNELITGSRQALIKSFKEESSITAVTARMTSYLSENSDTKNWVCYIRPA